jgi:hypothetical protein
VLKLNAIDKIIVDIYFMSLRFYKFDEKGSLLLQGVFAKSFKNYNGS